MHCTFIAAVALTGPLATAHAKSLRQVGEATTAAAEGSLFAELAGNVSRKRLVQLEAALRPMYTALPKGAGGYLGHQAVGYALHRLLLQQHGWFVVGLEPSDQALPPYLHGEWVPQFLQGLLEQQLGSRGIDLREIAALAATLEDLVRAETRARVDQVYKLLELPTLAQIGGEEASRLLEIYVMMYLDDGNFSAPKESLTDITAYFKHDYTDWASVESWMKEILGRYLRHADGGRLDRAAVERMANEMGERFGAFNDGECRSLKAEMLTMEGRRPGRVLLADFYRKGLYSHWNFDEKVGYLRAVGALDESDPVRPSVILPNYLASRTNCLVASSLYSVCCRNECEDLMAHLEADIAAPTASPQRIRQLVADLPVDAVAPPPVLSETLLQRLSEIADLHGGQVPLHGRLFSQWMHHAFPRECPYPHEGTNPQTPEEWMREADEVGTKASKEEMQRFLGNCTAAGACTDPAGEAAGQEVVELPWTNTERLLTSNARTTGGVGAALRGLRALLACGGILILVTTPRLISGPQQERCGLGLDDDRQKRSAWAAQKPWPVMLLIFALATLLEAVGLLDRTAFACTLGGGLFCVLALPWLVHYQKQCGKKGKSCL